MLSPAAENGLPPFRPLSHQCGTDVPGAARTKTIFWKEEEEEEEEEEEVKEKGKRWGRRRRRRRRRRR